MNLQVYYPDNTSNQAFDYIYAGITTALQQKYTDISIEHVDASYLGKNLLSTAAFGGISNLSIINPETNKCTILSFADIDNVFFAPKHGWEPYTIMQMFGGSRWGDEVLTDEQISKKHNVKYTYFQYPIPYIDFHSTAEKMRIPYNPTEKIRKAFFAGAMYGDRAELAFHMKGHPLINVNYPMGRMEYYELLTTHALGLSFNANGELSIRDFEILGLGTPLIRSEFKHHRYHRLIPGVHYIKGTEASAIGWFLYPGRSNKQIAEEFIATIETVMFDDDLLIKIANNGLEYYTNYCTNDYIIKLFIDLFKPELLL